MRRIRGVGARLLSHIRSALILLGAVSAVTILLQAAAQLGILGVLLTIGAIVAVGWIATQAGAAVVSSWRERAARKADHDD